MVCCRDVAYRVHKMKAVRTIILLLCSNQFELRINMAVYKLFVESILMYVAEPRRQLQ